MAEKKGKVYMKFIRNFSKYKYLLYELVKKEIKLKYRRSYLGILWTLLEPILTTAVLSFVFGTLYGKKDPTFPVYILTGRLLYSFFSTSTKGALRSIRKNGGMIKKVYVPKYIYPLSSVLSNLFMFIMSLIVLVGACILFQIKVSVYTLQAIVPILILVVMAVGIGLILSTFAVFFRDLEYLYEVLLMLVMYCSAIFYKVDQFEGWKLNIIKLNPIYDCIHNFRLAILDGQLMNGKMLLYSGGISVLSLIVGLIVFYRKQDKFILNI